MANRNRKLAELLRDSAKQFEDISMKIYPFTDEKMDMRRYCTMAFLTGLAAGTAPCMMEAADMLEEQEDAKD